MNAANLPLTYTLEKLIANANVWSGKSTENIYLEVAKSVWCNWIPLIFLGADRCFTSKTLSFQLNFEFYWPRSDIDSIFCGSTNGEPFHKKTTQYTFFSSNQNNRHENKQTHKYCFCFKQNSTGRRGNADQRNVFTFIENFPFLSQQFSFGMKAKGIPLHYHYHSIILRLNCCVPSKGFLSQSNLPTIFNLDFLVKFS